MPLPRRPMMWLVPFGTCSLSLGILIGFLLDHGFHKTESQFYILEFTYASLVLLGLLATLAGSAIWAWRASIAGLVRAGLIIGVLALTTSRVLPFSIHDWTFTLMLGYAIAFLISIMCLLFAVARFTFRAASKEK